MCWEDQHWSPEYSRRDGVAANQPADEAGAGGSSLGNPDWYQEAVKEANPELAGLTSLCPRGTVSSAR